MRGMMVVAAWLLAVFFLLQQHTTTTWWWCGGRFEKKRRHRDMYLKNTLEIIKITNMVVFFLFFEMAKYTLKSH